MAYEKKSLSAPDDKFQTSVAVCHSVGKRDNESGGDGENAGEFAAHDCSGVQSLWLLLFPLVWVLKDFCATGPKVIYVPPPPPEGDDAVFAKFQTGINFDKYDDILVDVSGSNPPPAIMVSFFLNYFIYFIIYFIL